MPKQKSPSQETEWISVKEAAALAEVHYNTVIGWCQKKPRPFIARKKGFGPTSPYQIDRASFMQALKSREGDAGGV